MGGKREKGFSLPPQPPCIGLEKCCWEIKNSHLLSHYRRCFMCFNVIFTGWVMR